MMKSINLKPSRKITLIFFSDIARSFRTRKYLKCHWPVVPCYVVGHLSNRVLLTAITPLKGLNVRSEATYDAGISLKSVMII